MATLVLSAVGTLVGGPLGAAVGGLIGNAFDHAVLFRPEGREGRRLTDLQLQTSSYGTQVPKIFGTMRVAGTVIWATDLKETKTRSGGGKGRPSVTSYSYSASFAVALSARAVRSVGRIWADGNLLRGAAGDFKTEVGAFRLYPGDEDQAVDPLIAAAEGIEGATAHRGIAYVLFEDLALADYGNRIPSLTFEVEADEGEVSIGDVASALSGGRIGGADLPTLSGFAAGGRSIGEAIAPLADAYGLALAAEAEGLRLRPAGAAAEAAVPASALCARANGRRVEPLERSTGAADGVPAALSVRHYDPSRDYQAGVQRAVRPGPAREEDGVELPVVLSADRARQMAGERLDARWAGRNAMTLRCGWEALAWRPGQTVTVEGVVGLWRIEEREWEAMAVRLALRRVPGAGGVVPPGASSGHPVRQEDAPHGATALMLADVPQIKEGTARTPLVVAAASGGPGWRGAALFLSGAGSEAAPIGRTAPRATMGQAVEALPPGSVTLVDESHALLVSLLAEDMMLAGADEGALAQGRNLCLVGRELIQFSDAGQTGPGSFRLTGLRRGLFGTDWAMAAHEAGEPFLLIEEDRLVEPFALAGGTAEPGASFTLMAVGIGDAAAAEAALTVSGEALVPPAPVHLTARAEAGGWVVRWVRRSRDGGRWSSGGDMPLAEERERYDLQLWDGAVLVRRAEAAEPVWIYDAGMRGADAAAGHVGSLNLEVRQVGTFAPGRAGRIMIEN
ncbi:phage tail protein [Sphingobium ummariense]|uniref:phage tail protein n=1 Tax=Sphingobium ummariense TaxID=420994 RepID=UPI00042366F8|nr:phage tail protein [Sphingobium ummariense]